MGTPLALPGASAAVEEVAALDRMTSRPRSPAINDQPEPPQMDRFDLILALLIAYMPMLSGYIMSTGFAD